MKLIFATSAFVALVAGCSATHDEATSPAVSTTGVTQTLVAHHAPGLQPQSSESHGDHSPTNGVLGDLAPVVSSPPGTDGDHAAITTPSTTTPSGTSADDIAVRVALTAFNDPLWASTLDADLEPGYALLIESERRGNIEPTPHTTLQFVAVESHSEQPNIVLVSFDEITDVQAIRHVTAITFDNIDDSRPLVVDVSPIA